jgi:hypothetical protein
LPEALLSRFLIVEVVPPPVEVVDALLDAMRADIAAEIGAAPDALPPLPETARGILRRAFATGGATPRDLRRALRAALGALALGEDPMPAIGTLLEPLRGAVELGFPRRVVLPR